MVEYFYLVCGYITLNVNGMRSAAAKGFMPWLRRQQPGRRLPAGDQGQEADLAEGAAARRAACHAFFHPAEKQGYSGVAHLLAGASPTRSSLGFGHPEFDARAAISRPTSAT